MQQTRNSELRFLCKTKWEKWRYWCCKPKNSCHRKSWQQSCVHSLVLTHLCERQRGKNYHVYSSSTLLSPFPHIFQVSTVALPWAGCWWYLVAMDKVQSKSVSSESSVKGTEKGPNQPLKRHRTSDSILCYLLGRQLGIPRNMWICPSGCW